MKNIYNRLLILRTPGIGPAKFNSLVKKFGDVESVVRAIDIADSVRDLVAREMDRAVALGISYIADDDVRYPYNLRQVRNHPPVISVRGNLDVLGRDMVAIVGTRHATATGMGFVANIAAVNASEKVGLVLYRILNFVSVPMLCSRHYVLSMFLWAFLLFATIPKFTKK